MPVSLAGQVYRYCLTVAVLSQVVGLLQRVCPMNINGVPAD